MTVRQTAQITALLPDNTTQQIAPVDIRDLWDTAVARGYASVKQWGALGNGVADDTSAILAAGDAVRDGGGGMLFFPGGTYMISASIPFKNNVLYMGEYGGTLIRMATNANLAGMFTSTGSPPFFGLHNMMLDGNAANQNGVKVCRGLALAHTNTSVVYGQNSRYGTGQEILDAHGSFYNVVIANIDGHGIAGAGAVGASGATCHFHRLIVNGCSGKGIWAGFNDGVWVDCKTSGTWEEGWRVFGGAARYYGCKAGWCGEGGDGAGGWGAYTDGVGFRVTFGDQIFIGCEAMDTDGPGWKIGGSSHRVLLSGCKTHNASNLQNVSTWNGMVPRGGGYVGKRCVISVQNTNDVKAELDFADAMITKPEAPTFNPNLDCIVEVTGSSAHNTFNVAGQHEVLGTNMPIVDASGLTSYAQPTYCQTAYGPWHGAHTLVASDTTPAVFGGGLFVTNNSSPTTITDFDFVSKAGAAVGETFFLRLVSNTTIQNGANIATKSGSNITAAGIYQFIDHAGVWREI